MLSHIDLFLFVCYYFKQFLVCAVSSQLHMEASVFGKHFSNIGFMLHTKKTAPVKLPQDKDEV